MILWYPPGAGGMWLNYLIWSGYTGRNIPGNHPHFELAYLKSVDKSYQAMVGFLIHTGDWKRADIVFGDDCYYFNFYLNLISKKPQDNWHYSAKTILSLRESNPVFNLTWSTLLANRSYFCTSLSKFLNFEFKLNSVTDYAIDQFLATMYKDNLDNYKFLSSDKYYYWACAVKDNLNLNDKECEEFTRAIYRPV